MRFNRAALRRWVRGPGAVLATGSAALALLALLSRGFATTREVIYVAIEWYIEPRHLKYDPRSDFVVVHFVPLLMALLVGTVVVLLGGRSLGRAGWRYWLYLTAKLLLATLLIPELWVEGGGAMRAYIAFGSLRVALALAFTLVFFGAFGCTVIWIFADQRHRCPVCLRRLALPVTIGSWASVFDPVTTEMVCDEGHGSLCVAESEISGEDRWIKLDTSWREF